MGDAQLDMMLEEVGLPVDEFTGVSLMLGELQQAAAELPAPSPGPELAKLLVTAPIRRFARRRRAAGAAGATVLALGSLGGAAAAHVLPEPVQGFVSQLPGPLGDGAPAPTEPEDQPVRTPLEREPALPQSPTVPAPGGAVPPFPGGSDGDPGRGGPPRGVPASPPTSVPAKVPANVPANVPAKVPANVPANVPAKVPADVPGEVPTDVPADVVPPDVPDAPPFEEAPPADPPAGPGEVPGAQNGPAGDDPPRGRTASQPPADGGATAAR